MTNFRSRRRRKDLIKLAFDPAYYLSNNIDVAVAGVDPLRHYRRSGWREGRRPNDWFSPERFPPWVRRVLIRDSDPFAFFLRTASVRALESEGRLRRENKINLATRVDRYFDADFYLERYGDVRRSGMHPLEHYLRWGWREKRRPNEWFDVDELSFDRRNDIVPFLEFLQASEEEEILAHAESIGSVTEELKAEQATPVCAIEDAEQNSDKESPHEADLEILRSHFDTKFYLARNPDVARAGEDPLLHFANIGWKLGRDPSPEFSLRYYVQGNKDLQSLRTNPYLHYLKHGRYQTWRAVARADHIELDEYFRNDPTMRARVAAAKGLDPMVAQPIQMRKKTSPLLASALAADCAEKLRKVFEGRAYRYVIAVPHVRMSGASRVAAIFAKALATIRDQNDILVITTDSSEAEYASWFPEGIRRYDLSGLLADLPEQVRGRLLIDLVRGIGCRTLVNVNSRLVWDSLRVFGRQMSTELNIASYLFTWEETPEGDRSGYPIQWLHDTSAFHRVVFTDTQNLAGDISDRLGFDHVPGGTVVRALGTPVEEADKDIPAAALPTDSDAPSRFLWAGRFDPQKRVDVLTAIARRRPEAIFDVYGKAVLGRGDLASFDPPPNMHEMGTYTDLDQVLATPYTGFVYTAQWDGLPTILLDMALREVPIVAPRVGGIAELIDPETGWLVEDFSDIDGYDAALAEMARNPHEARRRAARLKARIGERYSLEGYRAAIGEVMNAHDL